MSERIVGVSGRVAERAAASWPDTKYVLDRECALISGEYVTPGRVHGFDILGVTFLCIGVLAAIIAAINYESWGVFWLGTIVAFVLANVIGFGGPAVFARKLAIAIYSDRVEFGRRSYSLDEDVQFRVERHRRANQEAHTERFSGQRQPWVYRRALEVVMQYGELRIAIADMREKDEDKARALVIRLQNWCDDFAGMRARHVKQATAASDSVGADEFGPAPPIR